MGLGGAGQHKSTVTIEGRVDSADRAIRKLTRRVDKYERSLAKAERKQQQTGGALDRLEAKFDGARSQVDKLSKVLGAAGFVSAAVGAVQALDQLVQKTAQYRNVIRNLPFSIDEAKAATMGMVDGFTLAQAAIKANRLGVATTEEEFAKLAKAGMRLSLSMGGDAAQGVEELTQALGTGSAEVLNNLGITLKVADAQREYARKLGVSVDALTEKQKAEAFMVIGMDRAAAAGEKANVVIDDGVQRWNETKNRVKEFALEWLPRLMTVLELLMDILESKIEMLEQVADGIDTVINEGMRFFELGAIYDEQITHVRGLTAAYEELGLASRLVRFADVRVEAAEQAAKELEALRKAEDLRAQEEARIATLAEQQKRVVDQKTREIELLKAQGAHESKINKLVGERSAAQIMFLELMGKSQEAEDARWQERLRSEQEAASKREKWAAAAKARREAENAAEVGALERRADIAQANGRQTLSIELQILEVKRRQVAEQPTKSEAERIQQAEKLLAIETERHLKLIEFEKAERERERERRIREATETGNLEVGRLQHQAELLGRTAELQGEASEVKLAAIEAERVAVDAQIEQRKRLLEAEYGEEVYTNKVALAEFEQIQHDAALARIDARVAKQEWLKAKEAATLAERIANVKKWQGVISTTESAAQTSIQGTSKVYELAAAAQGRSAKTREKVAMTLGGIEMLIMGAVEAGKAIAAFASFNYVEGALHVAASAFNFAQGGLLVSGVVPTASEASASSGAGAQEEAPTFERRETSEAPTTPESVPGPGDDPPPQGAGSQSSAGGNTTIYMNEPLILGSLDADTVDSIKHKLSDGGARREASA